MASRLTDRDRFLRTVPEKALQAQVESIARVNGWRHYHAPDNSPRTSKAGRRYVQNVRRGFPDLLLVKAGRLIAAELKRETEHPTADQVSWLLDLAEGGVEVAVWHPRDVPEIVDVLAGAPMPDRHLCTLRGSA